jgi:hypothetical protein
MLKQKTAWRQSSQKSKPDSTNSGLRPEVKAGAEEVEADDPSQDDKGVNSKPHSNNNKQAITISVDIVWGLVTSKSFVPKELRLKHQC